MRKKGVFQARASNAADVYQMAQAARKARERQASRTSVVSRGEAPGLGFLHSMTVVDLTNLKLFTGRRSPTELGC